MVGKRETAPSTRIRVVGNVIESLLRVRKRGPPTVKRLKAAKLHIECGGVNIGNPQLDPMIEWGLVYPETPNLKVFRGIWATPSN